MVLLVRQAQSGNQAAFAQLVHSIIKQCYGSRCGSLGRRAMLRTSIKRHFKIYKKLDGFRFECSFSTWIYRIN